jgi:hypothetical protein
MACLEWPNSRKPYIVSSKRLVFWYNTLATFLSSLGFQALDADSSVFCRDGAIYVDDLLLAGVSKLDINKVKENLKQRFKISDLGACHFYLEIEVICDRPHRTLKLS